MSCIGCAKQRNKCILECNATTQYTLWTDICHDSSDMRVKVTSLRMPYKVDTMTSIFDKRYSFYPQYVTGQNKHLVGQALLMTIQTYCCLSAIVTSVS